MAPALSTYAKLMPMQADEFIRRAGLASNERAGHTELTELDDLELSALRSRMVDFVEFLNAELERRNPDDARNAQQRTEE